LSKQDPNIKKAQDDIKEMKSRISVLETRKNKLLAVLNKEEGKIQTPLWHHTHITTYQELTWGSETTEVARRMMATDKHAAPRRHHR